MIDFKKDFDKFLEQEKTLARVASTSLDYYMNNYAQKNSSFYINKVLSGYIYTFLYQKVKDKDEEYLNNRPFIFFINAEKLQDRKVIIGIDLILMFPNDRLLFLSRIAQIFQSHMVYNMDPLNTPRSLPIEYKDLSQYMRGINYNHAFRKYSIEKIKNFHQIPYPEWKYIPYLDTKSMQGVSLAELYKRMM